jgi:hypothetical protein
VEEVLLPQGEGYWAFGFVAFVVFFCGRPFKMRVWGRGLYPFAADVSRGKGRKDGKGLL